MTILDDALFNVVGPPVPYDQRPRPARPWFDYQERMPRLSLAELKARGFDPDAAHTARIDERECQTALVDFAEQNRWRRTMSVQTWGNAADYYLHCKRGWWYVCWYFYPNRPCVIFGPYATLAAAQAKAQGEAASA